MTTVLGTNPTTAIQLQKTEYIHSSAGTPQQIRLTYKGASSNIITLLPSIGDAHPTATSLECSLIEYETNKDPASAVVTYEKPTASLGGGAKVPPADTEIQGASANAIEIPITQNPNYDVSWVGSKEGVNSYISPQPVYSFESIVDSFVWSEENIISTVGKRVTPPEMTSPTADAWLHMGREIMEQGEVVRVVDSFQYASAGWDTDIYDAGTYSKP